MRRSLKNGLAVALLGLILCSCSEDNNAFSLNQKANDLYHQNKLEEARKLYKEADVLMPEHAAISYNQANTFYREQAWDKALEYYQKSLNQTTDKHFAAYFNQGCTFYRQAQSLMPKASNTEQIQKVVQLLQSSLQQFNKALKDRPEDEKTIQNIYLVKAALKSYLDALKRKQEEKQEKQTTSLDILSQIRWKQRSFLRQTRGKQLDDKVSLKSIAENQLQLSEDVQKFNEKFAAETTALNAQAGKQLPPQQQQQMQQMKKFVEELVGKLQEEIKAAHKKLTEEDLDAAKHQSMVLNLIDPIWKALAPPQAVLQDDIALQQVTLMDTAVLEEQKHEKLQEWNLEEQNECIGLSEIYLEKFKQMGQMGQMLPQQGQPGQGQQPPQNNKPDPAEIEKLVKEAIAKQTEATSHIQKKDYPKAQQAEKEALEILKKIAEKQGQNQDNQEQQQNQDKQDQQENQDKQEQQNQDKQDQQQNQQNQEQQMSKSQDKNQNMSKDQLERALQKVRDRRNKHKKDKMRRAAIVGGREVENDW